MLNLFRLSGITLLLLLAACSNETGSLNDNGKSLSNKSEFFDVQPDAGKTWNIFGLQIVGKIMSEDTGGKYSVIMSNTPPSGGPPPHIHKYEDELFYVVKGEYEFICGSEKIKASAGSLINLPKGISHSFKNIGTSNGILLNTITPGGFEKFFQEIDNLPKDKPLDRKKVQDIASQYGLEFIVP